MAGELEPLLDVTEIYKWVEKARKENAGRTFILVDPEKPTGLQPILFKKDPGEPAAPIVESNLVDPKQSPFYTMD